MRFLTNETTRNSKFEVVVLGEKRHYPAEDRSALDLALVILADNTWTDLDLVTELQDTSQDTATSNTSLQLLDFRARLVDIKGSNDDQSWCCSKVARWYRNACDEMLNDGVDVELQLSGYWDDG